MRISDAVLRVEKMRDDKADALRREQDSRVVERLYDDIAALDLAAAALRDAAR